MSTADSLFAKAAHQQEQSHQQTVSQSTCWADQGIRIHTLQSLSSGQNIVQSLTQLAVPLFRHKNIREGRVLRI